MHTNNLLWCLIIHLGLVAFLAIGRLSAQGVNGNVPRIVGRNGRHALLVDGRPFLLLAGQAHNSSAWPALMPKVWSAIEVMHANALAPPLTKCRLFCGLPCGYGRAACTE